MRILLITDWNRGRGGAEDYITWLRAGLRAAGDEVRLLTSSAGSAAAGTAEYVAFGSNRTAAQAFLQIANPFAFATVRRALREFRPDAVVVNMFAHHLSPALLMALRGWAVVLLVTDYKLICPIGSKLLPNGSICEAKAGRVCYQSGCMSRPHWMRDRPRYALIGSAMGNVTRVVTCSEWMRRALAADGIESAVVLLPVPPPSPGYRRAPASRPTFAYCGRLDVEKGVAMLLRALARVREVVPQAALRIIGRGPLRTSLERLAAQLHIADSVTFTGWLDPPQIEQHLAEAWGLVVPSLWAEPLGLVAIQAIVHGVPVIASRSGGLAEVVEEDRSGLLFPNGAEEALTEQMVAIAESRAFPSHTLKTEVIDHALKRHSIEAHIKKLRGLLVG